MHKFKVECAWQGLESVFEVLAGSQAEAVALAKENCRAVTGLPGSSIRYVSQVPTEAVAFDILLAEQDHRLEVARARVEELGEDRMIHHPCYSLVLGRRVRLAEVRGDWARCNENDGRTPVLFLMHLSQMLIY